MPGKGETGISDVAARLAVGGLQRNGVRVQSDPVQTALADKRAVLAGKIVESASVEVEAEAIEAENRRLEAEVKRRQLLEQVNGAQAQAETPAFMAFIMERIERTEAELAASREQLAAQQAQALQDRLNLLTQELQRLQTGGTQAPQNPLGQLRDSLALIHEIRSMSEEFAPPMQLVPAPSPAAPEAPRGVDEQTVRLYEIRANMELHRYNAEREDRLALRKAEIESQERVAMAKLQLEAQQAAQKDRVLNQTLPKLADALQTIATKFLDTRAPAAGVPVAADVRAEAVPPPVPPGGLIASCGNCGAPIVYMPSWPTVGCPSCGALAINDAASAPAPMQAATRDIAGVGGDNPALGIGLENPAPRPDASPSRSAFAPRPAPKTAAVGYEGGM